LRSFRSFYKEKIGGCGDLNVIFGKNDVGKSNIIRALNLFFNGYTDPESEFNFDIDFCDKRKIEADTSEGVRKFVYVKITFRTPPNYVKSLGREFYVKRQWTVSRGEEYVEEVSSHIKDNYRHILTRFMNQIRFMHIPAIKDSKIFARLLGEIYNILSGSDEFTSAVADFAGRVQVSTRELFAAMPKDITHGSKISAPSRMDQLFETLDFETTDVDGQSAKSLTLQRGDGIKVRHIPEILNFISSRDGYQFHIWGFEEPENSLDFASSEAEAQRFSRLSTDGGVQIFVTTHSPSFYNLRGEEVRRYYVTRDADRQAKILTEKHLDKIDLAEAIGDGFYLPAVARALEQYSQREAEIEKFKGEIEEFKGKIASFTQPVLLTEGKTDEMILNHAWKRLRGGRPPFKIKCCDITDGDGGGSGGATRLSLALKAVPYDNPQIVLGLFDRDEEGLKEFKLDKTFFQDDLLDEVKRSQHGRAFAILMPAPRYREACSRHHNLPIEYLFADEFLNWEVSGKRLHLMPVTASRKLGDQILRVPLGETTEYMEIESGSKIVFASEIVPTFPDEAFTAFEEIFSRVEMIIENAQSAP
jgi:hypothetical protein